MRRATNFHRTLHEFNELRAVDLVALVLGYGVLMTVMTVSLVSVFDWLEGRPLESMWTILAALGWARGAAS